MDHPSLYEPKNLIIEYTPCYCLIACINYRNLSRLPGFFRPHIEPSLCQFRD